MKLAKLLLTLIGLPILLAAQTLPYIQPSPNAASLGRYGNVPMNLSSGLPQPAIPLFNMSYGDLNMPVTLNYYYSGFKPSEPAGTTGLGWALRAGGVITRVVKGFHDEKNVSNGPKGYLYSTGQIAALFNPDGSLNCSGYQCPECFNQGQCDGEPDMFYFSFGDYSGKFFFGDDGLPHIVSDRKMKIDYRAFNTFVPIAEGALDNIYGFTLTTEDGTIFRFGDAAQTMAEIADTRRNVEFSYSSDGWSSSATSEAVITSWYLREVEDSKGNKVTLSYTNDYKNPNGGGIKDTRKRVTGSPYCYYVLSNAGHYEARVVANYSVSSENLLTQIQSPAWTIDLTYNNLNSTDSVHTLNNISLSQTNGSLIKKYEFNYSGGGVNTLLKKLREKSALDIINATHVFDYYSNGVPLNYNEKDIDYWGYYNGANNTELVPVAPYNANRQPNFSTTVMGALSKITYPAGGYTTFEYEQNQYGYVRESTSENGAFIGKRPYGGIRLKRMTDQNSSGNPPVVKDYTYDNFNIPSISSGVTLAPMNNYMVTLDLTVPGSGIGWPWNQTPNTTVTYRIYKSDPYYSLSQAPIYYFNVRETVGDVSRTDYTFTSHADFPDNLGVNYGLGDYQLGPYTSYDFARALPKNIKYYANNTLVSEKQISYTVSDRHRARTYWRQTVLSLSTGSFQFAKGLSTLSGWLKKTSEINTVYAPTPVTSTVNYQYDPVYLTLREQTFTGSKNETVKTQYSYPFDMPNSGIYQPMVQKNMISPVIEERKLVNNNQVSLKRTNYTLFNGNLYAPRFIEEQAGSNNYIHTTYNYYGYTANGNIKTLSKEGAPKMSYIWGYNNQYPIAQVSNATQPDIAYTSFEGSDYANYGNWSTTGTAPATDPTCPTGTSYYQIGCSNQLYKYGLDPLKTYLISYWSKNGSYTVTGSTGFIAGQTLKGWTYYEHTVTNVSTVRVSSDQNCWASIDELRLYPKDAQMTTFTYKPLVGMTSQTDAKGQTTYYEYDEFQRLKTIKDQNGNIIKQYCYNYAGQQTDCGAAFWNTVRSSSFTRNNCGAGYAGSTVVYTVAARTHSSAISQADADNKAQDDINSNGQAYANANGVCTSTVPPLSAFTPNPVSGTIGTAGSGVFQSNEITYNGSYSGTYRISYYIAAQSRYPASGTTSTTVTLSPGAKFRLTYYVGNETSATAIINSVSLP